MWHLFPPSASGGGSGGGGLDDVIGTLPISVEAFGTDRVVSITNRPQPSAGELPRGYVPSIGRRRVYWAVARNGVPNTAGDNEYGIVTNSSPAISTAVTIANTSFYTSGVRERFSTLAAINNRSGILFQDLGFRGSTATTGGLDFELVVGYAAINADSRVVLGGIETSNSLIGGSTDPSAKTNWLGFAFDAADTNIHLMHNDGSGTANKIDLGADFPRPTVNVDVYYIQIYALPTVATITATIMKLNDRTKFYSGSVGGDMMLNTAQLYGFTSLSAGPTAAVICNLDFYRMQWVTTL